jgi:L-serine dehydratase
MKYQSAFDIIGPAMVGPSSSHTAGSLRLGRIARSLLEGKEPHRIEVRFYGSFATTYQGHGSDVAVVAGAMGYDTHDQRIADALVTAKDLGIEVIFEPSNEPVEHPNTMKIRLTDQEGNSTDLVGCSIGGGKVVVTKINGYSLRYSGAPGLAVYHTDQFGMIEKVTKILSINQVNVSRMEVGRKRKYDEALMVIEVDEDMDESWLNDMRAVHGIQKVVRLHS